MFGSIREKARSTRGSSPGKPITSAMPQVLLVQPPIRDYYLTAKRTIPYGLACIAAAMQQAGYSVEILDALAAPKARPRPRPRDLAYLDPFYGRPDISPVALFHQFRHFGYSYQYLQQQIRRSRADIVGISSLFTAYSGEALHTAALAKRLLPRAAIVLGGHHPTALPESVMADPHVDYVLRGEGEIALPALAKALAGKGALEDVPGLVHRLPGGLHIGQPAWVADLDTQPPPAEALLKSKYYRRAKGPGKVLVTSRGCPFACSYCCLNRNSPLPYRRRGMASIARELKSAAVAQPPGFIDFEDENLTLHKPWFMELMDMMGEHLPSGQAELRAMNGLFPPSLDKEMVTAMADNGFKTLNLALATTHPQQLKRFKRPDVRPHLEKVLTWSREQGVQCVTYLIAGAPRQKAVHSLADLLYLAGQPTLAGLSIFYPAPGSPDYGLCAARGLLPGNPMRMRSSALPVDHSTSRLEAVTLLRLGRILNFMKQLQGRGEQLPRPTLPAARVDAARLDRQALGRRLLSWFFKDGQIRGVTPQGEVYAHLGASGLCREFLGGMPQKIVGENLKG